MEDKVLDQQHLVRLLAMELSLGDLKFAAASQTKLVVVSALSPPKWDSSILLTIADEKNPTVPLYTGEFDLDCCKFANMKPFLPDSSRVKPDIALGDWQDVEDDSLDFFVNRAGVLHAFGGQYEDTFLADVLQKDPSSQLSWTEASVRFGIDRVVYLTHNRQLREVSAVGTRPIPKPHGDIVGFDIEDHLLVLLTSRKGSKMIVYPTREMTHERTAIINEDVSMSTFQAVKIFGEKIYVGIRTPNFTSTARNTIINNWSDLSVLVFDLSPNMIRKVTFSSCPKVPPSLLETPALAKFLQERRIVSSIPESSDFCFLNSSAKVPIVNYKADPALRPLALRSGTRPTSPSDKLYSMKCFNLSEKWTVVLWFDTHYNLFVVIDNQTQIWHSDTLKLFSSTNVVAKQFTIYVRPDSKTLVALGAHGEYQVLCLKLD